MTYKLITSFALLTLSGTTLAICPPEAQESERKLKVIRCGTPPLMENTRESIPAPDQQPTDNQTENSPIIDVVFVLDTTGSMGGLIEGAKQKIWSIANTIAQAQQTPTIRFGLVGYRDRGDEYITTITELTEDIDTVYADLLKFEARGGGDTPESVNEALYTAIERFEWSMQEDALKMVYLVGDAPPKMEYKDDVKYQASCRFAYEKNININTIQCGRLGRTQEIWQEIAQLANGAYAAIQQDGGVVAISTPFDDQIRICDGKLMNTMIDYGNREIKFNQSLKRAQGKEIAESASLEAQADRIVYNYSDAGAANLLGSQELVDDYANEKIKLEDIPKDELPTELQSLSEEELKELIERKKAEREKIQLEVRELAIKRAAYIKENTAPKAMDGFDQKVLEALIEQGARVGIRFNTPDLPEGTRQENGTNDLEKTEHSKEAPISKTESSDD